MLLPCSQEEYIKEEQKNLKRELLHAQEEVRRIQSVPLVIGQFLEMVNANYGIVGSTTGSNYYVRILSTLNRELLKPSSSVALHRHSNALVDILPPEADSSISLLGDNEKPNITYQVSSLCQTPSSNVTTSKLTSTMLLYPPCIAYAAAAAAHNQLSQHWLQQRIHTGLLVMMVGLYTHHLELKVDCYPDNAGHWWLRHTEAGDT